MMNKKAQSEVIAILLILAVTVGAVAVAYRWAVPKVQETQDKSRIDSIVNFMEEFDRKIREVYSSGEGSQRFVELEFDKGQFLIHPPPDNNIVFQIISYTIEGKDLPLSKNLPYGSYLRVRKNEYNQNIIELVLEYTDIELEAEVPGSEELVLPPKTYNIFIRNMGGGIVRISRSAAYIGSTERFILSGYVYDNTEKKDEEVKENPAGSGDYQKSGEQEIIPDAEILVLNPQGNLVTSTRANSYGKYALLLTRSGEYFFIVNKKSYIMKEWDLGGPNINCDKYTKDFEIANANGWDFDVAPYDSREEIRIDFPLYMLEKPDILQTAPMAVIMNNEDHFNGIAYDIRDAFDNDPATHCNYFIIYGNVTVPNTPELVVDANFQYAGTADPIYMYPIEWLLDLDEARGVGDYLWGDAGLIEKFNNLAAISGDEEKIEYKDFALIIVGTGCAKDETLEGKLITYRADVDDPLSNFVSLGKLMFEGVEYSRGLITFAQTTGKWSSDPQYYHVHGGAQGDPNYDYYSSQGLDQNILTLPDDNEYQDPFFWQNNWGYDDERWGNEEAYAWLPEYMGNDLGLRSFPGVTSDWQGRTSGILVSQDIDGEAQVTATAGGSFVQCAVEFFKRVKVETQFEDIGANGVDTSEIYATVRDANGDLVSGVNVTFSTDAGTFVGGNVKTTNADGVATAILQSSTNNEIANVTATYGGNSDDVSVTFAYGLVLNVVNESDTHLDYKIKADGITTANIKATFVDVNGTAVNGQVIHFATTAGSIDVNGTTDVNGNVTKPLTSELNTSGATAKVTASTTYNTITYNSDDIHEVNVYLIGNSDRLDSPNANLINIPTDANPAAPPAYITTITAVVKDNNGIAIPNYIEPVTVTFSTFKGTLSSNTANTDENGVATVTLNSTPDAGKTKVKANIPASTSDWYTPEITFVAHFDIKAGKDKIEIGADTSVISVTITDVSGLGVPGVPVGFTTTLGYFSTVTGLKYNYYEVHRMRGYAYNQDRRYGTVQYQRTYRLYSGSASGPSSQKTYIEYDEEGASGWKCFKDVDTYCADYSWVCWTDPNGYECPNSHISDRYYGDVFFTNLAVNQDLNFSIYGYFDLTNTDWDVTDIVMDENPLDRDILWVLCGSGRESRLTIYDMFGGPTMLLKERRDEYGELINSVLVTSLDLDRYGNNYGDHDRDGDNESEGNVHGTKDFVDTAKILETNIIIWALGYEEVIS